MTHIPYVKRTEFAALIRRRFPDACVQEHDMNPEYESWRVEVQRGKAEVEVSWGPLTGFGGTDFGSVSYHVNPFAPFDVGFSSVKEAEDFVVRILARDF